MRQEFANKLAIIITGLVLLLAIIFALYQSNKSIPESSTGASAIVTINFDSNLLG